MVKRRKSKRKEKKPPVARKKNVQGDSERQEKCRQGETRKLLFFCIKFFVIFFVLEFIIDSVELSFFTNALASMTAAILGASSTGNIVLLAGNTFVVTNSCTGLISTSILAAIIFSLKKPEMIKKIALFVAGLAALVLLNIPRVALVVYSPLLGLDADTVHVLTWFVMSAAVLLIWYYGTKKITGIKEFGELL